MSGLLLRSSQEGPIFPGIAGDVLTSNGDGTAQFEPGPTLDFAPRIVWRANGTGNAKTWAEVVALIGTQPNAEIYVDDATTYTIPANASAYDVLRAYFQAPPDASSPVVVSIDDGAVLANLSGIHGLMSLVGSGTTGPSLVFDDTNTPVFDVDGINCILTNAGTAPMIELADGTNFFLRLSNAALVGTSGGALINATDSTILVIITENQGQTIQNDVFTGNAGSTLDFLQDGTLQTAVPTFAGFLGTINNIAKGMAGGSGPTSFRPSSPIPLGCLYFDQTLPSFIQWTGAAWVPVDAGGGGGTFVTDNFTAAPAQTVFNLSFLPSDPLNLRVTVNGVLYVQATDYTIALQVLTWLNTSFALDGDVLEAYYQR
jgi:hypothetical protein